MNTLSGCITVASAALADAGIDCVDTVAGGVAALVASQGDESGPTIVLDPVPSEHETIMAALLCSISAGQGRSHESMVQRRYPRLRCGSLHGLGREGHPRLQKRQQGFSGLARRHNSLSGRFASDNRRLRASGACRRCGQPEGVSAPTKTCQSVLCFHTTGPLLDDSRHAAFQSPRYA